MSRFTPGELEVMEVLWQESPLKPAEIEARLPRPIGNAALRSVLRILVEKGHLKRQKNGKAYYYRPAKPARASFRQMARKLADVFCNGSTFDLVAQLVKTEKLTAEDIRKLQDIARGESNLPSDPNQGERR
jgi:BlaI family transcriptional regulator, penicillinase repressor